MSGPATARLSSVLAPAGAEAAVLHEVSLVLFAGAAVIFLGTMALLLLALRRRGRRRVPTAWWLVGGGIVFPMLTLSALLLYATLRTAGLERALVDPPLSVAVKGRLWWWEVRYRDPAGGPDIRLANELYLPVGRPVQISLTSDDVIHSFWVPELGGKLDLVPGRVNQLVITPQRAGVYRGACAEYCGLQHARMALRVVAVEPQAFERWRAAQSAPAASAAPGADAALLERGRRAFLEHGCASCHSVRGVAEGAHRGPDLTHVGSRLTLGAGTLPNGPGAPARWLVGVQDLKPGARMPSFAHLDGATLTALSAWLEQLR